MGYYRITWNVKEGGEIGERRIWRDAKDEAEAVALFWEWHKMQKAVHDTFKMPKQPPMPEPFNVHATLDKHTKRR